MASYWTSTIQDINFVSIEAQPWYFLLILAVTINSISHFTSVHFISIDWLIANLQIGSAGLSQLIEILLITGYSVTFDPSLNKIKSFELNLNQVWEAFEFHNLDILLVRCNMISMWFKAVNGSFYVLIQRLQFYRFDLSVMWFGRTESW